MTEFDFDTLKSDYDRDGFVVVPGYLSDPEVNELRNRAFPLASRLIAESDQGGRFRNLLKSLHRHDDWFNEQLNNGRHLPLIRHLLDGDVYGASAAWFDRPEGESQGVGPHVDALGRDKYPDAGATIWFALDPVNVGNGCLHYLRGSHKNNYPDQIFIPEIDTDSDDAFAAELEPGDAVIHHALTVHWSGGNMSGMPRRAVSYFYFNARAQGTLRQRKRALS